MIIQWNIITNLYLADMLNQTIRKIVIFTGAVTTRLVLCKDIGLSWWHRISCKVNYPWFIISDGNNLF